ncbi:hypothetical protein PR001_g4665 [Phytophthora rubi]|uniref:RNase H type-1 domain-containing protein n=1 Tax=Phytophthora rubi TaxID=129364 RepID=A0A6A3NKZ9_9STRA|nr:hypothetical protein PR001_g4665 [Phytophthora rubi]
MAVMFPPVSSTASDASASSGSTFNEDVPSKTPSTSYADPCAATVPGTSTISLAIVSGAHRVSGSGPSAPLVGRRAAMVPGTSTSLPDDVSGAHCITNSGPSASYVGLGAATVPDTSTSALDVVSDAHCVSGSGPLASHVGLNAATVPGTSTSALDVVSDAHCVSGSDPLTSHVGLDAATVPGTSSSSPSVVLDAPSIVHVAGGDVATGRLGFRPRLYASFDGGFRPLSGRCAFAWCVWSSDHHLIQWQATTFPDSHSNNDMEAQGLLACLRWIRSAFSFPRVDIYGDSRVILSQALCRFACRAPHLASLIGEIRALGTVDTLIYIHAILRASNTAADGLCNWIMDSFPPTDLTLSGTRWPCPPLYASAQSPVILLQLPHTAASILSDLLAHVAATWSIVLRELRQVAHLVRARFVQLSDDRPSHPPVTRVRPHSRIFTSAADLPSWFDTPATRSCCVRGRTRCVPRAVFDALQSAASRVGVPFPMDSVFLTAGPGPHVVPAIDLRILDALVADCRFGISGTLALFRGQTATDPRPNKALRPWLYRVHLASYPNLDLLCAIAQNGLIPPWKDPSTRRGLRPTPANYPGARTGAGLVVDKLLADYYKGRAIIATMEAFERDPTFQSSAFALVPKKGKPLHLDGRIIHDLSAPDGLSVNAQTASEASPDATWDPFVSIARRICELRRRYPGYTIYAMIADIAEAFHHVPVHADHASAFGGRLLCSSHGIVSGMAIFGWTSSPGFSAVFGKAVRHYLRTGQYLVLGHMEPFWSFHWVDDIVLVDIDVDDRLQKAEKRLRDGVKLVFGSDGWHEGKFTTWSRVFHAVGIDWNIPDE